MGSVGVGWLMGGGLECHPLLQLLVRWLLLDRLYR
jgi:hypothetical protein